MDSLEVHGLLSQVRDLSSKVTTRSDADQLIDRCDDIGDILALLDEHEGDVIAEQMLEKFWRFTLRWYFFPDTHERYLFESSNEELYQRVAMMITVLRLYGDLYGDGLEPEALGQPEDRHHQRLVVGRAQPDHERPIDLEHVDGELAQVRQR